MERRRTVAPRLRRTFMLWAVGACGVLSWPPDGRNVTTAILTVFFFLVWVSDDSPTVGW
jgi:hypothetical protein